MPRREPQKVRLPRRLHAELAGTARPGLTEEARTWAARAIEARDAGDAAAVRRAAVRAKQAAPRAPSIRELLGLAALALGEWHEAAQELLAYRRLSADRRHDPAVAACYRNLGRPERALEFLEDLRQGAEAPDTWVDAQIERARAYGATGRAGTGLELLEALARGALTPELRARVEAAQGDLRA